MTLRGNAKLFNFTILSNEPVAKDTYQAVLSVPGLAGTLKAGQFVNVNVPGDKTHILRIPLSFSRIDNAAGTLELIYATVGEGTRRLSEMQPGETSDFVAPCGRPWRVDAGSKRAVLVSGGVGITPLIALAQVLAEKNIEFDACIGAQTAERLYGKKRLLACGAGQVFETTDDGSRGTKGFVTDALAELLAQGVWDVVYTCGPEPMMRGVARLAETQSVSCQVSLERMMSCAFGACNTCNVALARGGYASVCMDGPVFDAREVAW
ncbi:dihydroorotate dehydrogenase electron transfer subunit [Lancefieldella sp. Marseille-Q7238]|uniref:dihydroorotate dehydrogenase electron transfer subunit n=1 Tax=Lancefieldella sp. Marseille-Q7238 TaxID=3022127 RepID=UPI0024A80E15|nr:dihydroorotate dehydrogenase electron transfer subunit [Lancefieldella sp. Marseille-Q7238]